MAIFDNFFGFRRTLLQQCCVSFNGDVLSIAIMWVRVMLARVVSVFKFSLERNYYRRSFGQINLLICGKWHGEYDDS